MGIGMSGPGFEPPNSPLSYTYNVRLNTRLIDKKVQYLMIKQCLSFYYEYSTPSFP